MRVHAIIRGDVQGIGYRWFVEKTAAESGINGWVKNLPDGNVEVEAEGRKETLKNFLGTLKTGHRWARVNEIIADWTPVTEKSGSGFSIKF